MNAKITIDPGHGKVYTWTTETVEQARATVRGPYYRDCKILIETAKSVEGYLPLAGAGNQGILRKRLAFRERI